MPSMLRGNMQVCAFCVNRLLKERYQMQVFAFKQKCLAQLTDPEQRLYFEQDKNVRFLDMSKCIIRLWKRFYLSSQ